MAHRGDEGGAWRILQARYGTAERNVDVTGRLKELAREDRNLEGGQGGWNGGRGGNGGSRQAYRDTDGRVHTVTVAERKILRIR